MAHNPKVIVIFGATGQQGGSIVRAMKDDNRFILKAATRNTESESAKKLAAQGLQVIKADLDDAASCSTALNGAYGAFVVTNFVEHFEAEREVSQGKNIVDAAKRNGVQHLIYSAFRSPKEHIGKDGCHFMESKKLISDYIKEQGVPYTMIEFAYFYENFIMWPPRKNENGEYLVDVPGIGTTTSPDYALDLICTSDAGEVIHQFFLQPEQFKGRYVPIASDCLSMPKVAEILTRKLGKKFAVGKTTLEQLAKLPFPGGEDFAIMYEFLISGKCPHDIKLTRNLHPNILTFEQWVDRNLDILKAKYP